MWASHSSWLSEETRPGVKPQLIHSQQVTCVRKNVIITTLTLLLLLMFCCYHYKKYWYLTDTSLYHFSVHPSMWFFILFRMKAHVFIMTCKSLHNLLAIPCSIPSKCPNVHSSYTGFLVLSKPCSYFKVFELALLFECISPSRYLHGFRPLLLSLTDHIVPYKATSYHPKKK